MSVLDVSRQTCQSTFSWLGSVMPRFFERLDAAALDNRFVRVMRRATSLSSSWASSCVKEREVFFSAMRILSG